MTLLLFPLYLLWALLMTTGIVLAVEGGRAARRARHSIEWNDVAGFVLSAVGALLLALATGAGIRALQ